MRKVLFKFYVLNFVVKNQGLFNHTVLFNPRELHRGVKDRGMMMFILYFLNVEELTIIDF